MTLKDFWKYLPKTGWFFQKGGEMRRQIKGSGPKYCPLTAVAHRKTGKYFSSGDFISAGQRLRLADSFSEDIASAADCSLAYYEKFSWGGDDDRINLRKKLLKHTGLKETK